MNHRPLMEQHTPLMQPTDGSSQSSQSSQKGQVRIIPLGSFLEVPLFDNAINQWFWFVCVNLEYINSTQEYKVLFEDGSEKLMKLDPDDNGVRWKEIGTFNADFKISRYKKNLKSSMPPQFERVFSLVTDNQVKSNSDDKGTSRNGGIDETRKKVIASPDPVSIHVSHPIQSNLDQKSASNQLQTLVQLAPPPLRNQRPTNNQRQNTGSALQNEDGRSWRKFVEAAKLISTSVPNQLVEEAEVTQDTSAHAIVVSITEKVKDLIMQAITFLRQEDRHWMPVFINICQCTTFSALRNALSFVRLDRTDPPIGSSNHAPSTISTASITSVTASSVSESQMSNPIALKSGPENSTSENIACSQKTKSDAKYDRSQSSLSSASSSTEHKDNTSNSSIHSRSRSRSRSPSSTSKRSCSDDSRSSGSGSDERGSVSSSSDSTNQKQENDRNSPDDTNDTSPRNSPDDTNSNVPDCIEQGLGLDERSSSNNTASTDSKSSGIPAASDKGSAPVSSVGIDGLMMLANQSMSSDHPFWYQQRQAQAMQQYNQQAMFHQQSALFQQLQQQYQEQQEPEMYALKRGRADGNQFFANQTDNTRKKKKDVSSLQKEQEHHQLLQRHQHLLQQHQLHRQQQLQRQQHILQQQQYMKQLGSGRSADGSGPDGSKNTK